MVEYKITHRPEKLRFETEVNGFLGYVEYEIEKNNLYITHTVVAEPIKGRNVGSALVRSCFEYAQAHNMKVVPLCAYSVVWVKRHPEYEKMVIRL